MLKGLSQLHHQSVLLVDQAYEGNETRTLATILGYIHVMLPLTIRVSPWPDNREPYRWRNEMAQLCRRWQGCRRIFRCCEKCDVKLYRFPPPRPHH